LNLHDAGGMLHTEHCRPPVDRNVPVERLDIKLGDTPGGWSPASGVVKHAIQATEALNCRRNETLDLGFIDHVSLAEADSGAEPRGDRLTFSNAATRRGV
jgi:hypothetical protein